MKNPYRTFAAPLGRLAALALTLQPLAAQEAPPATVTVPAGDEVITLEKFVANESPIESSQTLLPTSRPVDSLYGFERSLLDTPRGVTVISPALIAQRGLDDVYDLAALVPGASVVNYYGVPGIPTTRGLFTSIYFNGMQRVWNRNGYPTSFGSLESIDYVRGPAPGTYSAASPGGFVNFIPKSPYYDKFRGSVDVSAGTNGELRAQVDVGGPLLIGSKPAAYRVSISRQDSDSYYNGIFNDYTSVYASGKMQLTDTVKIFTGGEFYSHRSKENPGWNRVTQDLIDNQRYITGNPVNDLTGASVTLPSGTGGTFTNTSPGFVNRAALETATPFGGTRGSFDGSFLAQSGFASSGFNLANFGPATLADYRFLGAIQNNAANPTTVRLNPKTVLTDAADFADADTYLFFFDTIVTPSPDFKFTNKFFLDGYSREKVSSYGYGEFGENTTLENKLLFEQSFDVLSGLNVAYGASVRYEDALALTEFTVEPFNRRDISQPVTQNTRLLSGGQRDQNGRTHWDPFGSHESKLVTTGIFLTPEMKFTDDFSVILSGRVDYARWNRSVPFGLAADFNSGPRDGDDKEYYNLSVSPIYKINQTLTAYGTLQRGTSFQGFYVSGGVDSGLNNFQESSLGEVGLKASLLDNKLFAGVGYFYQELVNFDTRGGVAFPQRGRGVEFESAYEPNKNFSITANLTWQEQFFRSRTIPGGFVPLSEADIVNFAGIFAADFGGRPNPGGPRSGIPEWSGSVFARYQFDNGFGVSGGPNFVDSVYANPDKTLKLPAYVTLNASIFYVQPTWEVTLAGRNLTDELFFSPFDTFAANSIIQPSEGISAQLSFKYKF